MTRWQLAKRVIDITIASIGLLLTLPMMMLVAALIWILEGRPLFYISQRRVAVNRSIPVIKFRTMVRDAHSPKYRLQERFMRDGYLDIPRTCEVYTPIGRILERLQIVELPQLLNVILHGMSLIGNRPLPARNVELLKQHDRWSKRFDSPAGITGIAQVVGKLQLTPDERLRLEGAYSDLYRSGRIVLVDAIILLHTLRVILFSRSMTIERAYQLVGVKHEELVPQPAVKYRTTASS